MYLGACSFSATALLEDISSRGAVRIPTCSAFPACATKLHDASRQPISSSSSGGLGELNQGQLPSCAVPERRGWPGRAAMPACLPVRSSPHYDAMACHGMRCPALPLSLNPTGRQADSMHLGDRSLRPTPSPVGSSPSLIATGWERENLLPGGEKRSVPSAGRTVGWLAGWEESRLRDGRGEGGIVREVSGRTYSMASHRIAWHGMVSDHDISLSLRLASVSVGDGWARLVRFAWLGWLVRGDRSSASSCVCECA